VGDPEASGLGYGFDTELIVKHELRASTMSYQRYLCVASATDGVVVVLQNRMWDAVTVRYQLCLGHVPANLNAGTCSCHTKGTAKWPLNAKTAHSERSLAGLMFTLVPTGGFESPRAMLSRS
jgi:hypothetical protein